MAQPLLYDAVWLQQSKYETAEAQYQMILAGTGGRSTQSSNQPKTSSLKSEIAQARQNIHKALNDGSSQAGSGDGQVVSRVNALEKENTNLKKASQDLTALVKKLEARVAALEKANGGAASKPGPAGSKPPAKKPPAADDDDDEIDDLFGSDSESEDENKNRSEETKKALAAYHAKKAKKPALIAKSSLLIDVKPWDDETDMKEVERLVRTIEMDGLLWGQGKLIPLAYGIKKLQINAVIEDEKVSTDDLEEQICGFEDFVQSMDIAAFNKI